MPEQHGLHLIWPSSFSTCWYWAIFLESGVWYSIPICYASLFFQIVLDLWCLHWLVLSWKIAHDAKAIKTTKRQKKGCNVLAFLCKFDMCLCRNNCENLKSTKKGGDLFAFVMSSFVLMTVALQHRKYRKTKKKGMFYVRVWKLKISKKLLCACVATTSRLIVHVITLTVTSLSLYST